MSTIDLLVLGILIQGARNAYELVRFIRDHQVHRVVKISEPAVFKSCRRLAEQGYIDGETVREAGVPDKVVYAINERGKSRFIDLMGHFAHGYKPFYLELNAVMWNIEQLDRPQAMTLLQAIQQQIHMARNAIKEHERESRDRLSFGPRQIVKQYRMTITTLSQWIDEVVEEFKGRI